LTGYAVIFITVQTVTNMSCGTCSEKTKAGAASAIGAPVATGVARSVAQQAPIPPVSVVQRCEVCGQFKGEGLRHVCPASDQERDLWRLNEGDFKAYAHSLRTPDGKLDREAFSRAHRMKEGGAQNAVLNILVGDADHRMTLDEMNSALGVEGTCLSNAVHILGGAGLLKISSLGGYWMPARIAEQIKSCPQPKDVARPVIVSRALRGPLGPIVEFGILQGDKVFIPHPVAAGNAVSSMEGGGWAVVSEKEKVNYKSWLGKRGKFGQRAKELDWIGRNCDAALQSVQARVAERERGLAESEAFQERLRTAGNRGYGVQPAELRVGDDLEWAGDGKIYRITDIDERGDLYVRLADDDRSSGGFVGEVAGGQWATEYKLRCKCGNFVSSDGQGHKPTCGKSDHASDMVAPAAQAEGNADALETPQPDRAAKDLVVEAARSLIPRIFHERDYAQRAQGAARRARLEKAREDHLYKAKRYEQNAAIAQSLFEAWAKENPDEARALLESGEFHADYMSVVRELKAKLFPAAPVGPANKQTE
jgi:hypothetical protein